MALAEIIENNADAESMQCGDLRVCLAVAHQHRLGQLDFQLLGR